MATTLQRKSRQCALYPTPHQGQKSPTGHQPKFYPRFHQGLLITANKFLCTKKSFVINHCSNGLILLPRHFNASRVYAQHHTRSGPKVAYWSSAHILLTLPPRAPHNSQHVSLHKKSVLIKHCSYRLIQWRRHFNASRDYALFTPHHIKAKSRLLAISPYFTHVPTKGSS